jgi:hypothetical protein
MNGRILILALSFFATCGIAMPIFAQACYSQQGSACVQKHYGNLDSTCENACAVGKTAESVQRALKDKGYDPGPIDGHAGPKTQEALRAFQAEQKMPQTGKMNKATLEKLGLELK